MVDYAVVSANVKPTGSLEIARTIASGAISAGMPIRVSGGVGVAAQADSLVNAGSVSGIALNSAADGQPLNYAQSGTVDYGAIFAVGDVVALSAAAIGAIAPITDIASTNAVVVLGVATSPSLLKLEIINSGVIKT